MELYPTKTGEFTLFIPEMNETYHSRDGAISEALHVFIQENYSKLSSTSPCRVLEIGFGTGLNALVTRLVAEKEGRPTVFHSLEPYPVAQEFLEKLGYDKALNAEAIYREITACKWDEAVDLSPNFTLKKEHAKIEDVLLENDHYNSIYFDAFAPKKQPELWDRSIFEKLYRAMAPGGILTTYSAAGQLKRDLRAVGFALHHPPGANGKREMTVAVK